MKLSPSTVLGIGLLFAAGALVWQMMSEWRAVDVCLDAGGSFHYDKGLCDKVGSHQRPVSRGLGEGQLGLAAGSSVVGLFLLCREGRAK